MKILVYATDFVVILCSSVIEYQLTCKEKSLQLFNNT